MKIIKVVIVVKKIFCFVIVVLLVFSLTGCKKDSVKIDPNYKELNIVQLAEYIEENLAKFEIEDADKVITDFEDLQKSELPKYIEKNTEEDIEELKKIGYKLETAEGDLFPVIDYMYYEKYLDYISKDLKEYFRIMGIESEKVPAKDAALIISKEEIFSRALSQESFLINYPESLRKNEIENLFNKYTYFIYYGLNNTPLFDFYTEKMKEEDVAVYLKVINDNPESPLIKDLIVFMDILEKNNFTLDSTSKEFRDTISPGLDV